MRSTKTILATACLTFAVAHPSPAAAFRHADVLMVSANGQPSATAATNSGQTYTITVTGVFSYNGAFGLSDCGHSDPAGPESWEPRITLTLDSHPAQCFAQPFSKAHTYQWTQPGTGRPFVFLILQDGGDDTGYLFVTVV